jgi:HipA-like protein
MSFAYAESWLTSPQALPLPHSLPLRSERYRGKQCRGYFAGVLPEESNREIIARNLGISARNDYAMLERVHQEDFCQALGIVSEMKWRSIPQAVLCVAARGVERAGHRPRPAARCRPLQLPDRQQ